MREATWPSSLYREPAQFWPLVILSTAVYGIVPLGTSGRAINLSLFDLVVVCLFLITVRDRVIRADRLVLSIALAAAALVLLHSVTFLLTSSPLDLAGLARETVKTSAFFLELLLLTTVIRAGGVRLPSQRILIVLFSLLTVQTVALHFQELYAPGSWFLPRNQHLATLSGVMVLAAAGYAGGAIPRRYLLTGLGVLIAVAFLLLNKTYLAVSVIMLALLPFLGSKERRSGSHIALLVAILLLIVFTMLFVSGDILRNFAVLERLDTIAVSLGFRQQLWMVAGNATVQSFPAGIGLGQFASYLAAETELAGQNLRFIHNTPLALVTELGLVGVLVVFSIVVLIVRATHQLPLALCAVVVIYLALPMLLHDALGLRMLALVLAAGLAGSLQQGQK